MNKVTIPLVNIRAAIFDMDGTMINNMPYHKKAWRAFLIKRGIKFSDKVFRQKISGRKNTQIFELVFNRALSPKEEKRFADEKEAIYQKLYAPKIKEIRGLSNVIQKLKKRGMPLAIATMAPAKNITFGLKALGLRDKFGIILGDKDASKGKPNPEIYLKTAKRLKVAPGNCLVFEDSPTGVEAGKRAGMTVVGILSTHSKEDLKKADYTVKDFSQISFL